ncbi:hypothetical protein FISHEDRAFT_47385 [Fistulina hepatica ATCC 64428]|uniref:GTP binding protein second domain-containing protein n=1 Tax=Fistulina hepatica ATCC 64428 TaxID=1128425 RepID=A0A0D7A5T6_9AGAR|nr:hypothetical protein FISHEDRAFT_47385 [Fistulina hepatica ATCC 64428]
MSSSSVSPSQRIFCPSVRNSLLTHIRSHRSWKVDAREHHFCTHSKAGIIEGAADGRCRGKQVIAVARTCNLILIVLDVLKPLGDKALIEAELEDFGIRPNKCPPNITVRKNDKGGIAITNTFFAMSGVPLTNIDYDETKAILAASKLCNCDVAICEPNATADDLIDVTEVYIRAICVLNKIDAIFIEELDLLYKISHSVSISPKEGLTIDELIEAMWKSLDLVWAYTKQRSLSPDYSQPVVLRLGKCTVEDFCNLIHTEIAKQMK